MPVPPKSEGGFVASKSSTRITSAPAEVFKSARVEMAAKPSSIEGLAAMAKTIRRHVVRMTAAADSGHPGGSLSETEIITALYFHVMRHNPANPKWEDRDRFILSKGHCCSALYAALANRGFFPKEKLDEYCSDGGSMWGHLSLNSAPGVDATTGSLGHGLSIGVGKAIAVKRNKKNSRVFVLLSDGECDEGSVWEAALSAHHFKLDNLVAIVDYNKIQSFGSVKEVMDLEPFAQKWASFGWGVNEIEGHDMKQIVEALSNLPLEKDKPSVLIAHTIKGKGVSFMENKLEWHYKSPNPEQYKIAMEELDK